jgi:hypothetical protein
MNNLRVLSLPKTERHNVPVHPPLPTFRHPPTKLLRSVCNGIVILSTLRFLSLRPSASYHTRVSSLCPLAITFFNIFTRHTGNPISFAYLIAIATVHSPRLIHHHSIHTTALIHPKPSSLRQLEVETFICGLPTALPFIPLIALTHHS